VRAHTHTHKNWPHNINLILMLTHTMQKDRLSKRHSTPGDLYLTHMS